ncbi:MAG TPA: AAC(3) family N-acetyltransferase [Tepidisphaeraceae bacterium]|jgi:aminoglycoside 3-N-acetyltransferase|nr:AAC(3) family N-acetyltransferase [Tepidisphaeraceae bacterium]
MASVTVDEIRDGIRASGIKPGDLLLAHSSLKSFGTVESGADAVAEALVQSVSPGGTVFVPTFNFSKVPWDRANTPSLTGAITEAFRLRPDAVRSDHSTHAVTGVGPLAQEILADHEKHHPFGEDSPLWRLWQRNAWVLLIGCRHNSSSMIHVAEENVGVPYLKRTRTQKIVTKDGFREVTLRRPNCSTSFNRIDAPLRAAGKIKDGTIGLSHLMLMRAQDIVTAASEMLRRDPAAFLCDAGTCEVCDDARTYR